MYYCSNEQSNSHPLNYYTVSPSPVSRPLECFHLPQLLNMTSHPPFLPRIHFYFLSLWVWLVCMWNHETDSYPFMIDLLNSTCLQGSPVLWCLFPLKTEHPHRVCLSHFIYRLPIGTWVASLCDSWKSCHYEQVQMCTNISLNPCFQLLYFCKKKK